MRKLIAVLAPALVGMALLASPAKAQENPTENNQPKPKEHIVTEGEHLSAIAEKHEMESWVPIWNVNTELSDPDIIHVGQKLIIPDGPTTDRPIPADVAIPVPAKQAQVSYSQRPAPKTAPVYAQGTGGAWAALRQCESGGNYAANTGNGYYGAYQYDLPTWGNYGGYARPDLAPPSVQDAKAQETQARRGWSPWPACSRKLGLR
jgi:hypothetical protein